MPGSATCQNGYQAEIHRHFHGDISPARERSLRLHLADCADCRSYYEKHLVLAELDPSVPGAEERIGIGLGLRRSPPRWDFPVFAIATAAALLCLGVAVPLVLRSGSAATGASEFAPRGQAAVQADFVVYRIRSGAPPERAPARMQRGDELAFAYTNAGGFSRLLVFGVDAAGGVHWYHPEWTDEAATPVAIPITKGADLHELPQAVRHELAGPTLALFAVFTNEPLTVKDIEGSLVANEPGRPTLVLPGVLVRRFTIEVE